MSGIVGILRRDGAPVAPEALETMMAAAAHRGPDGCACWTESSIGFGHQHFATTPEAIGEHQPLHDLESRFTIVFDGRVDNRGELIAALEAPRLRGAPDAAIVLAGYARWRGACVERVLGDFAFAVWDAHRRELFCARDPMGVRPFYYALDDRRFVFASDLRQVLAAFEPVGVNEGVIGEYLARRVQQQDETLYRGVFRLPAAHHLTVTVNRAAKARYWRYDAVRALRYADDREYAEHFRHLFGDAVACRLRSDRPTVGAYLSGGIDSSSVVGMARAHGASLETFSLIFPASSLAYEERFIDDVIAKWGLTAHRIVPTRIGGDRCRALVASRRDTPDLPADIGGETLLERMRARGMRVVLTGIGGDFGFTGSMYHYAELLRRGNLLGFLRQWRADMTLPTAAYVHRDVLMYGIRPLLPRAMRRAVRPLARQVGMMPRVPDWIEPDFARRVALDDRTRLPLPPAANGEFGRQHVCGMFGSGWTYLILERTERSSSEFGVEQRHPFFDRRLVEFAIALPEAQRWRGRQTKYVVREGVKDLLPPSVYARTDKADFNGQVVEALESIGGAALFDRLQTAELGWVRQARVSEMYRDLRRFVRDEDERFNELMFPLWMVGAIELWWRAWTGESHDVRTEAGRGCAVAAAG